MKRFFMAALAVALLASSAMAANVASITEDFGMVAWPSSGGQQNVFQNRSTIASHETPKANYSQNGFKWGGYSSGLSDNTQNYRVQFGSQGTPGYSPSIPQLQLGGNTTTKCPAGAYAYTIFSTAVGTEAPSVVTNAVSMTVRTPQANASSEETSSDIGVLLRNTAGDWFMQMDGYETVSMTSGVENEVTITFAGKNFQQLTGAGPADMNQMDNGTDATDFTPGALTPSGTNVSAPTDVTGMGILTATEGTGMAGCKFRKIAITGSLAPAPGVAVTVNSNPVADGATVAVDLGSYDVAQTAADVEFTVTNSGTAPLTVSGITVPTGVIKVEDLTAGDIAPSASDTFKVKLDTTAEVTVAGDISFTTNVTGAETFNFAVSGNVGPVTAVEEWAQYEK